MRNEFKDIIFLLMIILSVECTANNQSKNYYISPVGNDDNTGLTKSTAWKTLDKINHETFQPGDAILFESGGIWDGNLHPLGSGERGNTITISSFGEGPMPVINIGNASGVGIKLVNQSWWKIQGIEITSGAPPQLGVRREAISVTAGRVDSIRGISVRDCYIHDIWGQIGGAATSIMIYINKIIEDVTIENNTIKRCDKVGLQVTGKNNIVIRGNYLENIGGDAIIVHWAHRGLIEYNTVDQACLRTGDPNLNTGGKSRFAWWPHTAAIWISHATETIMQYNEVYNTGRQLGNGDGEAFDFDFGCENNILQYNYSRNNAGFLLLMDNTCKNITRYNISENDIKFSPTQLVTMFCDTTEQNIIHNNVFYVDHGTSDITYYYGDEYGAGKGKGKKDKGRLGAHFRNNIFYATGQGRFRTVYAFGDSLNSAEFRKLEDFHKLPPSIYGTRFYNNLYFGPWMNELPDDPKKILADPLFISPGSGRYGHSSLDGYKLKSGSPCFNKTVLVETGNIHDFYGNPVIKNPTDIGVYEKVDSGTLGKELRENTFFQTSGPWKPSVDIRSDVAIVYGAGDSRDMTLKEHVLEKAYLEYGSMVPMATLTGRKLTFNIYPIEERRRDWSDCKTPYIQKGHLIDLFYSQLPLLSEKTVYPGEQVLLFNIDRVNNQKQPQVLVTAARVSYEKIRNNNYSLIIKSPENTSNTMRLLLPEAPNKCSIKSTMGEELSGSDWRWDAESKTCFTQFENNHEGIQVEFSW
jgi:hypothetical protein